LVDDDAVGVLQHRLQRRVRINHLLATVLAGDEDVDHSCVEGTRSVQRARGDDVLEARRFEFHHHLGESTGFHLKHAGGISARDEFEGRRVRDGDLVGL